MNSCLELELFVQGDTTAYSLSWLKDVGDLKASPVKVYNRQVFAQLYVQYACREARISHSRSWSERWREGCSKQSVLRAWRVLQNTLIRPSFTFYRITANIFIFNMGRKCCVPSCKSGYLSCTEKYSVFSIPGDKVRKFNKLIPRKDPNITAKYYVCERHFEKKFIIREIKTECYSYALDKPRLSDDAVPTIFPDCPSYLSKLKAKEQRRVIWDTPVNKRKRYNAGNNPGSSSTSGYDFASDSSTNLVDFASKINFNKDISLPSNWATHYLQSNLASCIIYFSKVVVYESRPITQVSLMLEKATLKCFVFNKDTNTYNLDHLKTVQDFKTYITDTITAFDNFFYCYGYPNSKVPSHFCNKNYLKDSYVNVWRHSKCSYFTETVSTKNTRVNRCTQCRKINRCL
ncbi:uncharacterized protein LOC116167139 isoform X2 [Photinus pyralis]|uniref:uncharacterized protein LOC116167139 isoform X2 n=1 Tax=Photinus pyralis TaxID=7054 RepID=UPI001266E8E9|nr:uncharacterized protein LOC116167139 isoform X2 [Photinus pyralis]